MTIQDISILFRAAVDADNEFQAALVKRYGKDAGDMRYARTLPADIEALRQIKRGTDAAYRAHREGM